MKIFILAFLFAVMGMQSAYADGYVGILLGPSFVNQDIGTRFLVGARAGAQLTSWFSLGVYGTWNSLVSISGNDYNGPFQEGASQTILALEPNFYLSPEVPLYLGAKIGAAFTTATISSSEFNQGASETNFAVGPAVGGDFSINPSLSIGGEFNTIFINIEGESLVLVNVLGTLTYHF